MGSYYVIKYQRIMNKIFIAILTFCFAIASGQPTPNEICKTNTKIILNMANLVERVAKGEEKGDCVGCLASLTQTILGCASSETGIGIAICVAGIVGVGNTCYPCICWAIGISLVVIMKLFNSSTF